MRDFFDTSVLIAAFWRGHAHHESSLRLFAAASKEQSACGIHTLAEAGSHCPRLFGRGLFSSVISPSQFNS